MALTVEQIVEEAQQWPADVVSDLVDRLMLAKHGGMEPDLDSAWRSEALRLDGRDALVQRWDGALDGVGVKVGAMVTKKNDCLYDVLYVAPPARFDEGWGDFVAAVQGFRVGR